MYLLKGTGPPWTIASVLDPPDGATSFPTHPLSRISYGIQGTAARPGPPVVNASYTYGFFSKPSDPAESGLNPGFLYKGAVAEPQIVDDATGLPLPGKTFKTGTLRVRLVPPVPGAGVVYTLNGTEPGGQSAFYEPGQPLEIRGTTILRARSVLRDRLSSGVVTRTFIHLPTVTTAKRVDGSGLPLCDPGVAIQYASSAPSRGGDPTVTPPLAGFPAAGGIPAQLEARPIIALTWTDASPQTSEGWAFSFEYIDPTHPDYYGQENGIAKGMGHHPELGNSRPGPLYALKGSLHLMFRKAFNLHNSSRWQGPIASGTSAVFPGSPVSSFKRLILRDAHSDGWPNQGPGSSIGGASYTNDIYFRETQRALGAITGQRRLVHVYLNGLYWGVYDLGEFNNEDMVSDRLIAQYPSLATSLAPENFKFLNWSQEEEVDPDAKIAWTQVITAAKNAGANPASVSLWNQLTARLDLNNYIDYLITLELTGMTDHKQSEIRAWKAPGNPDTAGLTYPLDGKFRMIAWDGDGINFFSAATPRGIQVGSGGLALRIPENVYQSDDFLPHENLKAHPSYRSAFDARLRSWLNAVNSPLSDSAILSRYRTVTADVRLTLECEAMRWVPNRFDFDTDSNLSQGASLLDDWTGVVSSNMLYRLPYARADLIYAAQHSYLLGTYP